MALSSDWGLPEVWGEHLSQGNKGYFGITLNGQGISLLLDVTSTEHFKEKWNLL